MDTQFKLRDGMAVEHFDQRSLLLLGDTDMLVTLNRVGGDLIETILDRSQGGLLCLEDLAWTIADRYNLSLEQANDEAETLMSEWLMCGIVERCSMGTDESLGGNTDD